MAGLRTMSTGPVSLFCSLGGLSSALGHAAGHAVTDLQLSPSVTQNSVCPVPPRAAFYTSAGHKNQGWARPRGQESILQTGCQTPGHLPTLSAELGFSLRQWTVQLESAYFAGFQADKGKEKLCQPPGRIYCSVTTPTGWSHIWKVTGPADLSEIRFLSRESRGSHACITSIRIQSRLAGSWYLYLCMYWAVLVSKQEVY